MSTSKDRKAYMREYVKNWYKLHPEAAKLIRAKDKLYQKNKRLASIQPRKCKGCGIVFTPEHDAKKYCTKECRMIAQHDYHLQAVHNYYIAHKDKLRIYKREYNRKHYCTTGKWLV